MIRKYDFSKGDNAPAYAHFKVYGVYGTFIMHIDVGWKPSSALVAPSRNFLRVWKGSYLLFNEGSYTEVESYDQYNDGDEFQVYVRHQNPFTETGFFIQVHNCPGLLDISYYCQ